MEGLIRRWGMGLRRRCGVRLERACCVGLKEKEKQLEPGKIWACFLASVLADARLLLRGSRRQAGSGWPRIDVLDQDRIMGDQEGLGCLRLLRVRKASVAVGRMIRIDDRPWQCCRRPTGVRTGKVA
jgi:hypothetical protein